MGSDSEQVEKMKSEITRLERIIAELREELSNKRPSSKEGDEYENEKSELEIKLYKANSR